MYLYNKIPFDNILHKFSILLHYLLHKLINVNYNQKVLLMNLLIFYFFFLLTPKYIHPFLVYNHKNMYIENLFGNLLLFSYNLFSLLNLIYEPFLNQMISYLKDNNFYKTNLIVLYI